MASPGRHRGQRQPRRWVVPVMLGTMVAAAAAGFVWHRRPAPAPPQSASGNHSAMAVTRATADPMGFVALRKNVDNGDNVNDLIQAYGAWASRSDARDARVAIIDALLAHPHLSVGIAALLTAVELDPTARNNDPLWRDLVLKLAATWNALTLTHGRDLAQLETRPKARDLVIESLAETRPEKLADNQRPLLASDLIDLYPGLRPEQKPIVDRGLAALAGSDVVEIMAGRGLAEGSAQLHLARERARVLDDIRQHPVKEAPAEE
jgi:hypothetical protein